MEISFNIKEARKGIKYVLSCVSSSKAFLFLEKVKVDVSSDSIQFTATDLVQRNSYSVPIEIHENGGNVFHGFTFLIKKNLLVSLLKNKEDVVYISQDINTHYTITSGLIKFKVAIDWRDLNNYPKIAVPDSDFELEKKHFVLPKSAVQYFINATKFVSKIEIRPTLCGVFMHNREGKFTVAASDAHRLYTFGIMDAVDCIKEGVVITDKSVGLLRQFSGDISVSIKHPYIKFEDANFSLVSRLISGDDVKAFPKYEMILPKHELQICVIRKQLLSLLKVVESIAEENRIKAIIKSDNTIDFFVFDYDENEVCFSIPLHNPTVPVVYIKLNFNIVFLKQALEVNKAENYVLISIPADNDKPIFIDNCLLIMPMTVNKS